MSWRSKQKRINYRHNAHFLATREMHIHQSLQDLFEKKEKKIEQKDTAHSRTFFSFKFPLYVGQASRGNGIVYLRVAVPAETEKAKGYRAVAIFNTRSTATSTSAPTSTFSYSYH